MHYEKFYCIPQERHLTRIYLRVYTALFGPPPLKQARTVQNSANSSVQAPSRPSAGSHARSGHWGIDPPVVRGIAESTRAQKRSQKEEISRITAKVARENINNPRMEEGGSPHFKLQRVITSFLVY
ncbi:hypothetical protein OG21DRAFT_1516180 [Imleria badia]|nr:hypothetical protein OG21DRAFT_1516180 [Imleria badia]